MPSPWAALETQLAALRANRPANVLLGWELPHDARADHEIKSRRFEAPVAWAARHGETRPASLPSADAERPMHALLELLLLPGGRVVHQWIELEALARDPAAAVDALQRRLTAARQPHSVILPDHIDR